MKKNERQLRRGELQLHRDGFGFVLIGKGQDVFIPARFIGKAFHRDVVEVQVIPGRGGKPEGRIIRVVERRLEKLVGKLVQQGKVWSVEPDDPRLTRPVVIAEGKRGKAQHGDNVIVRVLRFPEGTEPLLGEVIEVIGERGEGQTEVAAVIAHHQLPRAFPQRVEAAASQLRMTSTDEAGREDLRHLPFVTIDGETAKDFDDAVAVERIGHDLIRLSVSIADVSHFVRPETTLDHEAYQRATSVYFPALCLPMLPEALSNDLCSLCPDEDRFTMTAVLDVAPDGKVVKRRFLSSIIRSRRRMTYTEVRRVLVDRDETARRNVGPLLGELELMEACFKRLRAERRGRGSIDFDLPEPEIVIDFQGDVENIVKAERHMAHMMIEDFMIAANEAVAAFLTERGSGCLYRVHEPPAPEKLHEFSLLLQHLGQRIKIPTKPAPGVLAQVVERVRGLPEERLINHQLLRSMAKAVYSAKNVGHYGLASKCYCHFTSPIRRYPDLVIHRLLKRSIVQSFNRSIATNKKTHDRQLHHCTIAPLHEIAEHCSRRERIAMEAEREMAKLHAALFMHERVDQAFDGVIAHVTKFGCFVELIDFYVEGLIPIASFSGDAYRYDERGVQLVGRKHGEKFSIGQRVRIVVENVDVPKREIVFRLASSVS